MISLWNYATMKAGERFWHIFDKVVTVFMFFAAAIVIFDAVAVTLDVIFRYTLSVTWAGLFEVTEYTILWITFLATTWVLRANIHVRTEMVVNFLNPRHRALTNIVASIIGIFLLAFMTWYTAKLTLHDIQTHFVLSSVLEPIKWPIEIIIPIGFFLLLLQLIRNVHGYLVNWRTTYRGQQMTSDRITGGKS